MKLLPLSSKNWKRYRSGYNRVVLDAPQWISELLENDFDNDHWEYLWDELHHQGDVGEASYAVVPYLAKYAEETNSTEWHIWAFPVVVELARLEGNNPDIPEEIRESYFQGIKQLASIAAKIEYWEEMSAPCMASCLALAKGQPIFARAYLGMAAKQSALDFLKEETGWEPQ